MSLLSPISKPVPSLAPKLVALPLIFLLATSGFAQNPAQQTPASQTYNASRCGDRNAADAFAPGARTSA